MADGAPFQCANAHRSCENAGDIRWQKQTDFYFRFFVLILFVAFRIRRRDFKIREQSRYKLLPYELVNRNQNHSIDSTNTSRQNKTPYEVPEPRAVVDAGFLLYSERCFKTGKIYYMMHPPACTNRLQTGTPGASRTQALAGGHGCACHPLCSARYTGTRLPCCACTGAMIKFISLYLCTNKYACLVSFLQVSFLRIVYFHVETLVCLNMYTSSEDIHWWYCSSVVGLGLLKRFDRGLPVVCVPRHWRLVFVGTVVMWDGSRVYSRKSRWFWHIFTLWQLWQKPTLIPSPSASYIVTCSWHKKKKG